MSLVLPLVLVLTTIYDVGWGAPKDEEIDRRGFFKKIRDAYLEGKASKNEKRIIERKEFEKLRRRAVFERNVKAIVDGISKRLKHRRSNFALVVVGSVVLVVWLCHKGSMGCAKWEEKPQSNHSKGVSEFTTGVQSKYSYSDVNIIEDKNGFNSLR